MSASRAAACFLILLGAGQALADDSDADPLTLYEEGRLQEAKEGLEELQRSDPKNPKLAFDLGNVAYRAQEYGDAVGNFGQAADLAAESEKVRSRALYNQGCAHYRAGELEEALEAFRSSLLANPGDEDAKANLEFILNQLNNQQQQQQNQQDPSEDSRDQQSQDQQQQQQEQQQDQSEGRDEQDENRQQQQQEDQQEDRQEDQQQQEPTQSDQQEGPEDRQDPSQDSQAQQPAGMSPEDVERLIEALELQEKTLQAERLKSRLKAVEVGKDW